MTEASQDARALESARTRISSDVKAQRIARTYAEALYAEAEKRGAIESVLSELEGLVNDVVPADPLIRSFFTGGLVGRGQRSETLNKAFGDRLSELTLNFLLVLNDHERLELLRPITLSYSALLEERSGKVRALVWSAVSLPDDQRDRLVNQLREITKREPVLVSKVDPDILGGLIVQVGDWRYDASVRHQLDIIRHQLIESSTHEIQAGRDRFSTSAAH